MRTLACLLLMILAGVSSPAEAQEYRRVSLPNGFTVVGEVVGASGAGMTLRLPSGDIVIPFSNNPEIASATATEAEVQPPLWIVVVDTKSPPDLSTRAAEINEYLLRRLRAIPHTRVTGAEALPEANRELLAECGQSVGCMLRCLENTGVFHAVVSFVESDPPGQTLRLISLDANTMAERSRSELFLEFDLPSYDNRILQQGYHLMGITPLKEIPDDDPVRPEVLATSGGSSSEQRVAAGEDQPGGAELITGENVWAGPRQTDPATPETQTTTTEEMRTSTNSTPVRIQLKDFERRHRAAVGLAFLPFPGLGSAHLRDPGGFTVNLALDVGAGFGLVYLFGAVSPSALGFYLPAILTTYVSVVLINQICVAVSAKRYKSRFEVAQTHPRVTPTLAAYPSPDGQALSINVGISITTF